MADGKLAGVQDIIVEAVIAVLTSIDSLHKTGLKTRQVVENLIDPTTLLSKGKLYFRQSQIRDQACAQNLLRKFM